MIGTRSLVGLLLGMLCASCAMGGPIRGGAGEEGATTPGEGASSMMMPAESPMMPAAAAPPQPEPSEAPAPAPTPPTPAEPEPNPGCRIDITAGIPPLPDACLPRFAPTTMERMFSCGDGMCRRSMLESDPTRPTSLTVSSSGLEDRLTALDCITCFDALSDSCAHDVCPSEMLMYLDCRGLGGTCTTQQAMLGACVETSTIPYTACLTDRTPRCFGI